MSPRLEKFAALPKEAQDRAFALLEPVLDIVASDIVPERASQDVQWGGPDHDDEHTAWQWVEYIDKQLEFITKAARGERQLAEGEFRERMVKVAALAVAAIQSYDRVTAGEQAAQQEECGCPACQLAKLLRERGGDDPIGLRNIPGLGIEAMVLDGADAAAFVQAILTRGRRVR